MQNRLKAVLGLGASFALVYSVGAYSCILGVHPVNCHTLNDPCTTYNAPGCVGTAVNGNITAIGVNMASDGYAGSGQTGHDGSSQLRECVATCSSNSDCHGAQNVGTVSMGNWSYWTMLAETCGPM
jgi:hypothetical protein